jgi:hypothetical protein
MAETFGIILESDSKGIRQGKQDLEALAGAGGKAESSAISLKGAMAALGAVVSVGMFANWIKGAIDAGDAASKNAQAVGLTTEEYQKLDLALKMGTSRGVDMTMAMSQLTAGMQQGKSVFSELGIAVKNTDGSMRSSYDVMRDVADSFAGIEDGAAKTSLAIDVFGQRIGPQLIPFLNQGADAMDEVGNMAEKLGIVMSADAARGAEEFNDNLTLIGAASKGVATQVASQLLPTFNNLTNMFLDTVTSGTMVQDVADGIAVALKSLVSVGTVVGSIIQSLGQSLGALAAAAVELLSGNFKGAFDIAKEGFTDMVDNVSDTKERLAKIWSDQADEGENAARRQLSAFIRSTEEIDAKAVEMESKQQARIEREAEREAMRLQRIREQFATESQLEQMRFDEKMAMFEEFATIEDLSEQEKQIRIEEMERAHQERLNQIRLDGMTEAERIREMGMYAQTQLVASEFNNLLSVAASGNDKFMKASRVAGATQAFIATLVGQAEALKLGWPLGPIAALKIAATGMGLVNAIKGGGKSGGGRGGGGISAPSVASPQLQAGAGAPRGQTVDFRIDTGGRRVFRDEEVAEIIGGIADRIKDGDNRLGQVIFA